MSSKKVIPTKKQGKNAPKAPVQEKQANQIKRKRDEEEIGKDLEEVSRPIMKSKVEECTAMTTSQITPTNHPKTKRVGIFIFDQFEPLDVWGFVEAFSIARFLGQGYSDPTPYPFELVFIGKQVGKVKSMNGPAAWAEWDLSKALEKPLDLFMIPGGLGTRQLLDDKKLLDWVRAIDKKVPLMSSVCTGAAVLARAGLLDSKPAATNHSAFAWVTEQGPNVLWDSVSRWVDAGKYVTSAGVSAGTDMAFYLVSRLAGRAVAENAARAAEYDWHRDPQQPINYPPQLGV